MGAFSKENKEAHIDAFNTQSFTKLFIGSYTGTLKLVDANTVQVTITQFTTANSLFGHLGTYLADKGLLSSEEQFNRFFNNYTPFFHTTSQTFTFNMMLTK